jgi:hypothetical protein
MNETNNTTDSAAESAAHKAAFASLEEAKKVTPPSKKFKLYKVPRPDGTKAYSWAWTGDAARSNVAKADGYGAELAEPKGFGPLTKERATAFVAARLADFTDEELAAMGLSRKKAKR